MATMTRAPLSAVAVSGRVWPPSERMPSRIDELFAAPSTVTPAGIAYLQARVRQAWRKSPLGAAAVRAGASTVGLAAGLAAAGSVPITIAISAQDATACLVLNKRLVIGFIAFLIAIRHLVSGLGHLT